MYAYCNNNPVMYVDPSGESPTSIIALGVFVGATGGFVISSIISDIKIDEPIVVTPFPGETAYGTSAFLYIEVATDSIMNITSELSFDIGLYTQKSKKDNYNMYFDTLEAGVNVGYTGISAKANLLEVGVSNEYEVNGETKEFYVGVTLGVGIGLSFGEQKEISLGFGIGFTIKWE